MANSTKIDYYASTAQVIVLDPQFNVLESEDQFITLHKGENLIDKDPFFEKIKTAFVNGGPFEFGTVLLKSLDNNKVFNIKLIDGDNKTIILQDVTSFKPSSSNFESSAFYHHLRSPLASISNLSEVLKLTALNRDQLEIVNQLEISTKKGLSFIEELSMANQFSRGKLTVQQREFDAAKVTASILDFMRIEAVEKGIAKFPKVSKPSPSRQRRSTSRKISTHLNQDPIGGMTALASFPKRSNGIPSARRHKRVSSVVP